MKIEDLKKFCSIDDSRHSLHEPFTIKAFTYATNGCIAVRVPQIAEVIQATRGLQPESIETLFSEIDPTTEYFSFVQNKLPKTKIREEECKDCNHDCPCCVCRESCEVCEGTGSYKMRESETIFIDGVPFDSFYLNLIQQLPGVVISRKCEDGKPMPFKFESGDGLLMPLRPGQKGTIKNFHK